MKMNQGGNTLRKKKQLFEKLHLVTSLIIILLCFFILQNLSAREYLFPFVFLLASAQNFISVFEKRFVRNRSKKQNVAIYLQMIFAGALFVLAILAGFATWR